MCDSLKLYLRSKPDPCPATDTVFSVSSCNIHLSNAQPLKMIKVDGFPVSGEAAKGWKKQVTSHRESSVPAYEAMWGLQQRDSFGGGCGGGCRGVDGLSGLGIYICIVKGLTFRSFRGHSNTNLAGMKSIRLVFSKVSAKSFVKRCFHKEEDKMFQTDGDEARS